MGKKLWLFLACMLMSASMAFAQRQITGTVIDAETDEPLIGVSVRVPGTNSGMLTDANGKFSVTLPAGQKNLEFSFMGMKPATLAARPGMVVRMETDTKAMDEVMVVAFGTAKKSAYTGSAKVVDAGELSKASVSNITEALAGAVPGLQLTSNNGAPGSSPSIRIRGFSSITAGQEPLIIVDGAPYSGDLNNINPNDIESVTVLKDAASNSLYGARGANGVLMITTKKAKQGEAVISFEGKWGSNSRALRQYDIIDNTAGYYEAHYGALNRYYQNNGMDENSAWIAANKNMVSSQGDGGFGYSVYDVPAGQMLIGQNGKLNPNAVLGRVVNYKGQEYFVTPDNWLDASTRNGFRQEYNVTANGSNDRSNFYANIGYLENNGITMKSDMKRLTGRLKADYLVKDWAKVGMNFNYARFDYNSLDVDNNGNTTSTGNVWAPAMQMAPIYPFYMRNADGSMMYDGNGLQMFDYGDGMNAGLNRPYLMDAHPYNDLLLNKYNSDGNASNGTAFADFYLCKGLTLTINGAYNLDETRVNLVYNPYYGQFDTTGGTVIVEHDRTYNYNLQQLLNYNFTVGQHNNFALTLGHEYYDSRATVLYASKHKMFNTDNTELNGAIIDNQGAGSYKSRYNVEGYFGRLTYDFDERIFVSGSYRRDASSRFAPENRWGNFWSAGAAWRIAKESWFPKTKWLNELKVKASVGSQGNDGIGSYRYTDLYSINNSGGNVGISFDSKGNRDITWETNTNINAGIEFGLWNNRLTGSVEFYNRLTTDMLFSFSVAPSLGYSSYMANIGDMRNRGVEIDLSATVLKSKNFQWDVNWNMATLQNRIMKLDADKKTTKQYTLDGKEYEGYVSGSFFRTEGGSIYQWRQKEYAGIYTPETYMNTVASDAAAPTYDESLAGSSMWYKRVAVNKVDENGNVIKDADGTPVVDHYENVATTNYSQADYYMTDKSTVPPVYGGFGTTLRIHNFDLSANFSYQIGGYGYDGTYQTFMSSPTGTSSGYNFHKDLLNAWTPENTHTDIPRFMWGDLYSAGTSTRFLTKASYLNIENINLGYSLPSDVLSKCHLSRLRVYACAENVFYWSKRKGFDPRQTYSGTANATYYSPIRSISAGVQVAF